MPSDHDSSKEIALFFEFAAPKFGFLQDVVPIQEKNPDDCPSVDTVCYTAENKDSFIREMYKGVQGDLTLEEVDSILRSK